MEFEEMKKIWDSQNNQPLFAIDEKTLHRQVTKKIKSAKRSANIMEYGLLGINAFVIIFMIIKGVLNDNNWLNFLTAGVASLVLIYVLAGRKGRMKKENKFEKSLLGELDSAIANIDYLISRGKTFIWWYMLPFAFTLLLSFYFKADSKSLITWIEILIMFIVAAWLPLWEVKKSHLPRKNALISMKKTLVQE